MSLCDEDLLEMYRCMKLSRIFEEQQSTLNWRYHPGIGAEGTQIGTFFGKKIRKDDIISPHYRGVVGAFLARGLTSQEIMSYPNLFFGGKIRRKINVWPWASGVLATRVPQLAGAALVLKNKKTDRVVVMGMGDGACNLGAFHEGLNFASINKLPLVLTIINNFVFMHTSLPDHMNIVDIADRSKAYGISGISVDGTDAVAVHEAVEQSVERAREGDGPIIVECKSYRLAGHWSSDPVSDELYMPKWIIDKWKVDPIEKLGKDLLKRGILTDVKMREIDEKARVAITEAFNIRKKRPSPGKRNALELEKYVYA